MTAAHRRAILGDALALGVGTGVYAISFGALAVAAGLSAWQAQALSLLMFTGASQFALIAVVASGGSAAVAIATSTLVGTRNAFYAVAMAPVLDARGPRRLLAAQAHASPSGLRPVPSTCCGTSAR
jgi:predicted branched-subunit amino acid permease